MKQFDDLISAGRDSDALRMMAQELYRGGKIGHTRMALMDRMADTCDEISRWRKAVEVDYVHKEGEVAALIICPSCDHRTIINRDTRNEREDWFCKECGQKLTMKEMDKQEGARV